MFLLVVLGSAPALKPLYDKVLGGKKSLPGSSYESRIRSLKRGRARHKSSGFDEDPTLLATDHSEEVTTNGRGDTTAFTLADLSKPSI